MSHLSGLLPANPAVGIFAGPFPEPAIALGKTVFYGEPDAEVKVVQCG
jgi:hypothetical protein